VDWRERGMNRHERRCQAKIASRGKFVITGEFLGYDDLIELLDHSPALAPTLDYMLAAMEGSRPPLCGGCGATLTVLLPPAAYLLLRHSGSGEQRLSGLCFECISGSPEELRERLARALGVEPIPAAHLHYGSGGRA
jgi:hypothetical protein